MGMYDIESLVTDLEKAETAKEAPEKKKEEKSDFLKLTLPEGMKRIEFIVRFTENLDAVGNCAWVQRDAHMFPHANKRFCYQPCPKRRDILANVKPSAKCPICEDKDRLYDTGDPAKEQMAQKRNPKKRYFHVLKVIKDPRDGGKNEGKFFIYEFGDQILKKILAFLKNKEIPISDRCYFHPLKGTNFKIVITKKGDQLNYDDSDFCRNPSPMTIGDTEITSMEQATEYIRNNGFKLNEKLLASSVYKSYEEIKELYDNQGEVANKTNTQPRTSTNSDKTIDNQQVTARNPEKKVPEIKTVTEEELPFSVTPDDDDAKLEALLNG